MGDGSGNGGNGVLPNGLAATRGAPWWFYAIDKLGAPTFILLIVVAAFGYYYKTEREDRKTEVQVHITAYEKQNETVVKALGELTQGQLETNRQLGEIKQIMQYREGLGVVPLPTEAAARRHP